MPKTKNAGTVKNTTGEGKDFQKRQPPKEKDDSIEAGLGAPKICMWTSKPKGVHFQHHFKKENSSQKNFQTLHVMSKPTAVRRACKNKSGTWNDRKTVKNEKQGWSSEAFSCVPLPQN